MAVTSIKSFGGISPRVSPRLLESNQAQVASNCTTFAGAIVPLTGVGSAVATLTKIGLPTTIYRFGQDAASDTNYWFHWLTDVDVARSQIAGDTSEWTFYTDGVQPKATYSALALSGSGYPSVSRPLGLPAPTTALIATASNAVSTATLYASDISRLASGYKVGVSLDGSTWTDVTVTTLTAAAIAAQLTVLTDIDAVVSSGNVVVTRTGSATSSPFTLRFQVGTEDDTTGTFTYNSSLDKSDTGNTSTSAYVVIEDAEIGAIANGHVLTVRTSAGVQKTYTATGNMASSAALASALTSSGVTATAYGSCVVLQPGSQGGGSTDFIEYKRMNGATEAKLIKSDGSESAMAAYIIITDTDVTSYLAGKYAALTVNIEAEKKVAIPTGTTIANIYTLESYGLRVTVYGSTHPIAVIKTELVGSFATLRLRAGAFPVVPTYIKNESGVGSEFQETRVYTYTFVNKEAGFEFESAPCFTASQSLDVLPSQKVTLTSFSAVPSGYVATHRRIYRATAGTFLYVAEIGIADTTYVDATAAEDLGEELATLTWTMPPAELRGLINLPNGIMAGFKGRDVYFCDPYHPHAWPLQYQQSLDYPVVGLGRMDTTLAVLTNGVPYFIQGSHPDSMVVVKTDVEQSCASKRSIVSMAGAVIYASPDGLVKLTPGGSSVITQQLFTHALWQQFNPSSIKAFQHDMKYIAFYDTGTVRGGFVFDLTTGEFVTNDIFATAGYNDPIADKLYLAFSDGTVKVWMDGAAKSLTWRSKKFSYPKPISMGCAQLDSEAYPMTVKFYVDGTLAYTHTVTDRSPFRIAAVSGRDWEAQIEGTSEVFGFAMAQSMTEMSDV